jgi:hypothetical protein
MSVPNGLSLGNCSVTNRCGGVGRIITRVVPAANDKCKSQTQVALKAGAQIPFGKEGQIGGREAKNLMVIPVRSDGLLWSPFLAAMNSLQGRRRSAIRPKGASMIDKCFDRRHIWQMASR